MLFVDMSPSALRKEFNVISDRMIQGMDEVFEELKKASENHLAAFQMGSGRNGGTGVGYGAKGNGQNAFDGKGTGNMAELRGSGNGSKKGLGNAFAYLK